MKTLPVLDPSEPKPPMHAVVPNQKTWYKMRCLLLSYKVRTSPKQQKCCRVHSAPREHEGAGSWAVLRGSLSWWAGCESSLHSGEEPAGSTFAACVSCPCCLNKGKLQTHSGAGEILSIKDASPARASSTRAFLPSACQNPVLDAFRIYDAIHHP